MPRRRGGRLHSSYYLKLIIILFFVYLSCIAHALADQVALKNGDRVTGRITKIVDAKLTIKTEKMGTIEIPWNEIESVTVEDPLNLTLNDGILVRSTFTFSENEFETGAPDELILSIDDIVAIRNDSEERNFQRLSNPRLFSLWRGTGTVGVAGTAGNSRTSSFTTGLNAERATRTDKMALYFNLIKASAMVDGESENTAEAVRGGVSYAYNASELFFYNVFNDYEYDRFQDLDLRFAIGGGMGFKMIKSNRSRLEFLAGSAYSRASYSTPLTRNSAELYWGNEYTVRINTSVSLIQSYRMFNDLTNPGMYRVNFNIGLNTKIWEWLRWNVSVTDRYVSDPAPGRKRNDFLYTTGISVAFSR
jgi:putative salt-induced outer membrane protein YdiY